MYLTHEKIENFLTAMHGCGARNDKEQWKINCYWNIWDMCTLKKKWFTKAIFSSYLQTIANFGISSCFYFNYWTFTFNFWNIKTYLRNTIGQECANGLILLNIYRNHSAPLEIVNWLSQHRQKFNLPMYP